MRIYIAIGCIVLLGPLSQRKVLGNVDLYGPGDRDLYIEDRDVYNTENDYGSEDKYNIENDDDYGSGEGPDTDTTYLDHEGSGHGPVPPHHGPYGPVVYDNYDDSEDGLDDLDREDLDETDVGPDKGDEEAIVEGSGNGVFIDDDDEPVGGEVYEPEFGVHETVIVAEAPKAESEPTTPPPTLTDKSDMESPVQIHTTNTEDRKVSIFAQPDILAAFIGGAIVGLLCAILLVMFIVYRMRKKDEGSYPLDEPKRMPLTSSYSPNDKEIYA